MKVLKNIIVNFLIVIWLVIAIATTICLFSYNQFNISEIAGYTLLIIDNKEMEPTFKNGDLVLVSSEGKYDFDLGEEVFFYNESSVEGVVINQGTITGKEKVNSQETTYQIEDRTISSSYVIGAVNHSIIWRYVGFVLNVFQSRWGYMFFVILPTLFALIYEIIAIVEELKEEKEEN